MNDMTRDTIKQTTIEIIKEIGLINLSCDVLCECIGMRPGSFPHMVGCKFSEFVEEIKQEIGEEMINTLNTAVTKTRIDPELRKDQILNIAIEMAKTGGYHKISRDSIAKKAGVSQGLVSNSFHTMKQLRRAIMRAAIHRKIPEIVAQGIANQDDQAKKAPPELKKQALDLLADY